MRNHQQVAVRLRDAAADELADSGPRDSCLLGAPGGFGLS